MQDRARASASEPGASSPTPDPCVIRSPSPDGAADLRVRRARAGDFAAFEELYRQHVGRVYAICLRMTANAARAEEETQETFLRAWRKLGSLRGDSGFGPWLRRVAINTVLGERRSARRRLRRERPMGELVYTERVAHTPSPGSAVDLDRAMNRLPAGAREIFVLHDVEGFGHEEIAGMLGLAVGTSKSQLHRARRLLREALR